MKTVERNSHNMYYARVYLLERDPSSKADNDSPVGTAHFSYPVEHLEKTLPVFAPTSFLSSARDIQLQSLRSEESNLSEAVRQGRRIPSGLAHINQGMMVIATFIECFLKHFLYFLNHVGLVVEHRVNLYT